MKHIVSILSVVVMLAGCAPEFTVAGNPADKVKVGSVFCVEITDDDNKPQPLLSSLQRYMQARGFKFVANCSRAEYELDWNISANWITREVQDVSIRIVDTKTTAILATVYMKGTADYDVAAEGIARKIWEEFTQRGRR